MMPRRRRIALLLGTVTDLYGGNRQSAFVELERRADTTLNQLGMNGLGNSTAVVTELQRVYRDGLRAHETLLLESLQRVLKSNRFVPRRGEVKQIVDFVLGTMKSLAASFNEKINTHARNAGVGSSPGVQDLEAGLDARIRGEVAVLFADLRKEVILPWRERAVGKIVIGVVVLVLAALVLWFFGIGNGATVEYDRPKASGL